MASYHEILESRMSGTTAALEGRKLDANPYSETDELHFEWLGAYAAARLEARKVKTAASSQPTN